MSDLVVLLVTNGMTAPALNDSVAELKSSSKGAGSLKRRGDVLGNGIRGKVSPAAALLDASAGAVTRYVTRCCCRILLEVLQ